MSWHGCDSVVEREQGQATSPTQREGMVWHKAARPRHRFENPRKDRPLKGPANQPADETEDLEGGYGQQPPVNPYSVSLLTAVPLRSGTADLFALLLHGPRRRSGPGRDQRHGELARGVVVQRPVADQAAVPEQSVGEVGEEVQVGVLGDLAAFRTALQQYPQDRAAAGQELLERGGGLRVLQRRHHHVLQLVDDRRVLGLAEGGQEELRQITAQRAGVRKR